MNVFLRHLRITSWPIWVKLLAGFTLAALLPFLSLAFFGWDSINTISTSNFEIYLKEVGSRQQPAFNAVFEQAYEDIVRFTDGTYFTTTIRKLFQDPTSQIDRDIIESGFQSALIETPDKLFEAAWLLDLDGRVIATEYLNRGGFADPRVIVGLDESASRSYQTARNFEVLQRSIDFVVYTIMDEPIIEIVGKITEFGEDEAIGYIVAQLNMTDAILPLLDVENDTLSVYSFLVDAKGEVIAETDMLERARISALLDEVTLNFGKQSADATTQIYRTGSDRSVEVLGYHIPITLPNEESPRFVLVSEIDRGTIADHLIASLSDVGFPLIVGLFALVGVLLLLFYQLFMPPLIYLSNAIRSMAKGDYDAEVPVVDRLDELGQMATAFVNMREQVESLIKDLSIQMEEQVRDIEATQAISRFVTAQRDLQSLMDRVVEMIVEHFPNIYHAQIFLMDKEQRNAILRASSGEVGRRLLTRGHHLAVGSASVIGQVTEEGRYMIARDTMTSEIHKRNEFLPDTTAELAIPLRVGRSIIGALDVQSKQRDSFSDNQVSVLQTMADQIAIAIQNAELYHESVRRLQEIELTNRLTTRRAWEEYMAALRRRELSSDAGVRTLTDMHGLRRQAVTSGKVAVGEPTDRQTIPIAVPIVLRGQPLGAVEWELPMEDFSGEKVLLAQELVNRLTFNLDNARLFQESQQAIERERLVNTIATQLTQQTNINDILETAVREVGQALRSPLVSVQLDWGDKEDNTNGSGNNSNGQNNT